MSSEHGEIAAKIASKTQNPKARAFLEGVFKELLNINDILDHHAEEGIPAQEYDIRREDSIPKLQNKFESVYSDEERARFATEECLPVNGVDVYGMAAAHYAAEEGNLELLIDLVKQGADLTIRDHSGHTPRDKARRHGHINILEYIDSLFPDEPDPPKAA